MVAHERHLAPFAAAPDVVVGEGTARSQLVSVPSGCPQRIASPLLHKVGVARDVSKRRIAASNGVGEPYLLEKAAAALRVGRAIGATRAAAVPGAQIVFGELAPGSGGMLNGVIIGPFITSEPADVSDAKMVSAASGVLPLLSLPPDRTQSGDCHNSSSVK